MVGVAWPLEMENGQGIFMGQGMKSGGVLRIIHLAVGRDLVDAVKFVA